MLAMIRVIWIGWLGRSDGGCVGREMKQALRVFFIDVWKKLLDF